MLILVIVDRLNNWIDNLTVSIIIKKFNLFLECLTFFLEFCLILVKYLDLLELEHGELKAILNWACGIAHVMDHHVQEQLALLELSFELFNLVLAL